MKKLVCLFFVISVLLSSALAAEDAPKTAIMDVPAAIADSLPWFAIRELDETGTPFTKAHLQRLSQQNKRVALVYFATWCIPCREGVKKLAASYKELNKNKVAVLLVNIGESDEKLVKKWVDKIGASLFTVVIDPFKRTTESFGMIAEGEEMSLPRTLVVNSEAKPLFMLGQEGSDWPQILWK